MGNEVFDDRQANRRQWSFPQFEWHDHVRRLAVWFLLPAALAAVVTVGGLRLAMAILPPPDPAAAEDVSTIVVDRSDRLLRAFTTAGDRWRMPVEVDDVDKRYLALLLMFEDKRFHEHGGVDVAALVRAAYQLVAHRRIISGASTLTMQVARLLDGRHERTAAGKLRQIVHALQLEASLSKKEILRLYLRLAPFGGNLEGVRAASLAYFGKEPVRLSLGEAALLVALPQSPESRRPDRDAGAAKSARDRVLARAAASGLISTAEAERAMREAVPNVRRTFPLLAPHLAEQEVARARETRVHRTTIDREAQQALQDLVAEQIKLMGPKLSAALLAVDHATGKVIAYVGSAGYLDDDRSGAIDMVQAIRSPGSTLKPLIYGLAFESGLAHPETLIDDRRTRFGNYSPENFDDEFHGTVTVRQALGVSLNIPAVKLLHAVGPAKLVGRLRKLEVVAELPARAQPSLAIALGGIGMRMVDLVRVYSSLARNGEPVAIAWRRDDAALPETVADSAAKPLASKQRLLQPVAAWYVTDILKEAPVPINAKAGRIAYKTGTSYGYRDAWAVGYDGRHTIAVWVGRPDATSTPGLLGRTSAAPILFDAFTRLSNARTPLPSAPSGVIRGSGSDLPPPLKRFRDGSDVASSGGPFLENDVAISFPPDRSELDIADREGELVVLKASGGVLPLTWLVDGIPIATAGHRRQATWQPEGRGFVKFTVVDARGRVDRVNVRLK